MMCTLADMVVHNPLRPKALCIHPSAGLVPCAITPAADTADVDSGDPDGVAARKRPWHSGDSSHRWVAVREY